MFLIGVTTFAFYIVCLMLSVHVWLNRNHSQDADERRNATKDAFLTLLLLVTFSTDNYEYSRPGLFNEFEDSMVHYSRLRQGLILGFTQDAPQIFMKIANNMLIGKDWTLVMILSPLLSCYSVSSKLALPYGAKKHGLIDKTPCTKIFVGFYLGLWIILPVSYIIYAFFISTEGIKPDWAKDVNSFSFWNTFF